ncbi:MAG: hypothetical protein KCHDKBKB_01360 [Elusimicrobia bacterium]|nr:hypothetical protein [Elusimicrobiota bacterium]
MIKWYQVLLAFILGVGVTVGVIQWKQSGWHQRNPYQHKLERFSKKLDLSEDQRIKIKEIFEAKRKKIDDLRADMRPKYDEIYSKAREEIRQTLQPAQIEKYDKLEQKMEERRKQRRERKSQWRGKEK